MIRGDPPRKKIVSKADACDKHCLVQEIVLTIKMVPGQGVQVSGPIHDKGLCYAMLELARDAIKDHKPNSILPVAAFQVNGNPNPRAQIVP